ncbi:MAG: nitrate reductase molybdenum cofactor assembly chaperone [Burkholderiaceae bacterium]|jgi:nitrate reductase delta subunit|nr:nitrate reductase molybdenum cofactor assembly chaperone [Burkholderiaceae bacterium]
MMKTLKLIGVLLDYPQDELWLHRDELLAAAHDAPLPAPRRAALAGFAQRLLDSDPLVAQDAWLSLFDRGRFLSLLMFEHIHGESRDRGQAMVDLMETYRQHGFEISAHELPDYLPLMLEYLSQQPRDEALDWLRHIQPIVGLLAARTGERHSGYQTLFEILVELAGAAFDYAPLRQRVSQEPRDDTAEAMDRVWEEEAVRFGAGAPPGNCAPAASQQARTQVITLHRGQS